MQYQWPGDGNPYGPGYNPTWGSSDFVWYYYFGGGAPINLADIGLLMKFQSAPDVVNKVNDFKSIVLSKVANAKSQLCPVEIVAIGDYSDIYDTTTNVTREIFSVGQSTFFRRYTCGLSAKCNGSKICDWNYKCKLHFSIRDMFADPLDIGIEPGGTPYQINAYWDVVLTGPEDK